MIRSNTRKNYVRKEGKGVHRLQLPAIRNKVITKGKWLHQASYNETWPTLPHFFISLCIFGPSMGRSWVRGGGTIWYNCMILRHRAPPIWISVLVEPYGPMFIQIPQILPAQSWAGSFNLVQVQGPGPGPGQRLGIERPSRRSGGGGVAAGQPRGHHP